MRDKEIVELVEGKRCMMLVSLLLSHRPIIKSFSKTDDMRAKAQAECDKINREYLRYMRHHTLESDRRCKCCDKAFNVEQDVKSRGNFCSTRCQSMYNNYKRVRIEAEERRRKRQ